MKYLSAFLLICSLFFACSESNRFQFDLKQDKVLILEGDTCVLAYQIVPKSKDGKYTRANYVHPLWGVLDDELTEDFPDDHLHHRGIFWTWHQTYIGSKRIGDAWECRDFIWENEGVAIDSSNEKFALLKSAVVWKSPLWKNGSEAFAREHVLIRVHKLQNQARKIDFEIQLNALVDSLSIGGSEDRKGYGGFSWRVKMPDDLKFFGKKGEVEPEVTAVKVGSWLGMTGTFTDAGKSSIVVLQNPENPGYPQPWILRKKGSMQNAVWPGRDAVIIPKDKPVKLAYRMTFTAGDFDSEFLDSSIFEYKRGNEEK